MEESNQSLSAAGETNLELTTEIVAAYVSNNPVPSSELPALIESVWYSLNQLGAKASETNAEKPIPAVPIKKSVTRDYLICLEDGSKFKSLKRPLMSRYGMTPEEYRAKWGLSSDYPMTAPSYAARRSELAKQMRLGQKPQEAPKKTRGRKKSV